MENSSLLVEPERGAPDTPGGDHETDVQDRGIGGGGCDVGEKGGQAEERGMDNENSLQLQQQDPLTALPGPPKNTSAGGTPVEMDIANINSSQALFGAGNGGTKTRHSEIASSRFKGGSSNGLKIYFQFSVTPNLQSEFSTSAMQPLDPGILEGPLEGIRDLGMSAVRMYGTNMPSQEFPVSLERRPEVMGKPVAPEAAYSCADAFQRTGKLLCSGQHMKRASG
ncbi:hypothetical protein EK904_009986, partial [Melospiza melodia maxima]